MKTTLLFIVLLLPTFTFAQVLEARPFADLIEKIRATEFTYKETGKIFGFVSTQSCLHLSEDIAIFKNYCYPVRKYPARGYTIITREWGIVELYEEQLTDEIEVRQITLDEFPVYLVPYLGEYLPSYTLRDLSDMIAELYPRYNAGCWSTNFSKYTETNDVNCTVNPENVMNFGPWAEETQKITLDKEAWYALFDEIEAKLVR